MLWDTTKGILSISPLKPIAQSVIWHGLNMENQGELNRLEHFILSISVDDIEPLYVIYRQAKDDVPGATIDSIISTLIKLTKLGYLECLIDSHGRKLCENITENQLKEHCQGKSEHELRDYPFDKNFEYEFRATRAGRVEESNDIYEEYYPIERDT